MRNGAPLMFLICLYFWSALNILLPVPVELSGPLKSTLCSSDHFKLSIDKIKLDSSFIFPTKCELKVVIGPKTCGESKDDFIGKGEWCLVSFSLSFSPLLLLISYNPLASSPLPESWETAAPTSLPEVSLFQPHSTQVSLFAATWCSKEGRPGNGAVCETLTETGLWIQILPLKTVGRLTGRLAMK